MATIKGNFGGPEGPTTIDNLDLTLAKEIKCEKCEHTGFKQTMMLKRLSALVSPNGQEAIVPVMAFACDTCGHINDEFLNADITAQ